MSAREKRHDWIPSTLGHGETMCRHCRITNREAAVLGEMEVCPSAPTVKRDCWCGRPEGQCVRGDLDYCPNDHDELSDGCQVCPRCMGDREVSCHCGGDLCVCENYGDAPCPTCHGEGEVTNERAEQYFKAQREMHAASRSAT